jgi:hypothetical protein
LAGKPRESLKSYERAELLTGATAGTTRGVRAALARLKNDPRVELPLPRLMFPFWYRFALKGRILFSVGVLLGLALLFGLAMRAGRRLSVLALCLGAATVAQAWPFGGRDPFAGFFDNMPALHRMNIGGDGCTVRARAGFGSTVTMVGEPVDLVSASESAADKNEVFIGIRQKVNGKYTQAEINPSKYVSDMQTLRQYVFGKDDYFVVLAEDNRL